MSDKKPLLPSSTSEEKEISFPDDLMAVAADLDALGENKIQEGITYKDEARMLRYVAGEYKKIDDQRIMPGSSVLDPIKKVLQKQKEWNWGDPRNTEFWTWGSAPGIDPQLLTTSTATNTSASVIQPLVAYAGSHPNRLIFQDPPVIPANDAAIRRFATILESFEKGLSETWHQAWKTLQIGDPAGAATSARRVLERIAEKKEKNHPWLRKTKKREEKRVFQLASVQYGDNLPSAFNGNPLNDGNLVDIAVQWSRLNDNIHGGGVSEAYISAVFKTLQYELEPVLKGYLSRNPGTTDKNVNE